MKHRPLKNCRFQISIFLAALLLFTSTLSQGTLAKPGSVTALPTNVNHALYVAVKHHDLVHAKALLKACADPNCETIDTEWNALLTYAAQVGDCPMAQLLLQHGAKINHLSGGLPDDEFALLQAARAGKADMVKLLIRNGANVNLGSNNGRTALIDAANSAITKILLDHRADADACTSWENGYWTALMGAAERGDIVTVKLLLAHGASVTPVDRFGLTALGYALQGHHFQVVRLLRRAGARKSHGPVYL